MPSVPTILRPVASIKFEMSSVKHLCYIVNTILAHVILKFF